MATPPIICERCYKAIKSLDQVHTNDDQDRWLCKACWDYDLWKFCVLWMQDQCNDYEHCGAHAKCQPASVKKARDTC